MKNLYKLVAWIMTGIGVILVLCSIIGVLAGGWFMEHRWATYYFSAYNFFMLAIVLLLFYLADKKEK
jgi:hypothetical protein